MFVNNTDICTFFSRDKQPVWKRRWKTARTIPRYRFLLAKLTKASQLPMTSEEIKAPSNSDGASGMKTKKKTEAAMMERRRAETKGKRKRVSEVTWSGMLVLMFGKPRGEN